MDAKRDFHRDLRDSRSAHNQALISRVIANMHPGARLEFASEQDDRNGADVFVHLHRRVGIDLKLRAKDCMSYSRTTYALKSKRMGVKDGRFVLNHSRIELCGFGRTQRGTIHAAQLNSRRLRESSAKNGSKILAETFMHNFALGEYQTVCVYVPRSVVDRALADIAQVS